MLNRLLNKLFNKGRSERTSGTQDSPKGEAERPVSEAPSHSQTTAPKNLDIPNRLEVGLKLKAVPENLQGRPKAWDVEITRLDLEGIWVMRTKSDEEPVPAEKGKLLSLVLMEDDETITYDCPVLRIEPGIKEEILVAPPTKTLKEESQIRNVGARKHLRISFRLPAEVRPVRGAELGDPVTGHTLDISMSGLALECNATFHKGEEIQIRILSWNFPLQVRAFVVRCAPGEQSNTIAVTFPPDLSTISSDLISQFILENQRKS